MKRYNIYLKDKCIFHLIDEEEFKKTWNELNIMVGIMKTDCSEKDLYYKEMSN